MSSRYAALACSLIEKTNSLLGATYVTFDGQSEFTRADQWRVGKVDLGALASLEVFATNSTSCLSFFFVRLLGRRAVGRERVKSWVRDDGEVKKDTVVAFGGRALSRGEWVDGRMSGGSASQPDRQTWTEEIRNALRRLTGPSDAATV